MSDSIPTPIAAILILIGGIYLIWKWVESGYAKDKTVSDTENHS